MPANEVSGNKTEKAQVIRRINQKKTGQPEKLTLV
jgi:hypothetical protein